MSFKVLHRPDLAERAIKMWVRYCKRNGYGVVQQPSGGGDVVERDGQIFMELENVRGRLATYRYNPKTDRLFAFPRVE